MYTSRMRTVATLLVAALLGSAAFSTRLEAQQVTYKPYIQPGDTSTFGARDQIVVAWQTSETTPNTAAYTVEFGTTQDYGTTAAPQGRVVNNYLAADSALPVPPTAVGAQVNYYALLTGLAYDTTYYYRVNGPGMPTDGFTASFRTRTLTGQFSFMVQGDEGGFRGVPGSNPARQANYEARIVNLMHNVHNISFPGEPALPKANLALNTGDNVYNVGSEANYRDFWMPVWNNDVASNETGAPFLRSIPYYIVAGNHDIGGNGDFVNLLGNGGARYNAGFLAGDALAYYNNYYFPLNGLTGVDPQYVFNGDAATPTGFFFERQSQRYDSPAAIEALRASTTVDTGQGTKRQIDHMSNYSFDYGNAHFVFLDANPHLFNALVDYTATADKAQSTFPDYPTILREWLINDLDASKQLWKFVVYHQPAFSSGNGTLRNFQMRRITKALEDHGVNIVFNGHEHNYQRTHPLRALPRVADTPTSEATAPAVAIDTNFDGVNQTVPDGVIHIVEGSGGFGLFDSSLPQPRGNGTGVDQEETATGTFTLRPDLIVPNGPASWLDTNLTNVNMAPFFANAGGGPKITARFKAKLFSFADVVVNDNALTLYQISEPLLDTSSATSSNPAPYGTDANGNPANDPLPDTLIDPTTGEVVTPPAEGTPALLDKFTVIKPDVTGKVAARLIAPRATVAGGVLVYTISISNNSAYALNGAQAVVTLPQGVDFVSAPLGESVTQHEQDVVVTIGRLAAGERRSVQVETRVRGDASARAMLRGSASLRSGTALPVTANRTRTRIIPATR